jgi:tRNA 2-thiouridine synthesizing protein A
VEIIHPSLPYPWVVIKFVIDGSKVMKLDITKDLCPITFVKTKLALEQLNPGDRLEVFLNEGEPLENIPKSLKEYGYVVQSINRVSETVFKIIIDIPIK